MKKTNVEQVRKTSKALLHAVPLKPNEQFPFIMNHPFTSNTHVASKTGKFLDLTNPNDAKIWLAQVEEVIDELPPQKILTMLVNSPYYLTWLSFVEPYLSEIDFAECLEIAWTEQENPNMDVNVSTATAIKWFKKADKKALMDEEDYEYWGNLPETVTLYRGVARNRKKYGISWTDDKEKAIWFKNRWATEEESGRLLKVVVNKKHCLCYLDSRGEKEIVLDVNAVKNDIMDITDEEL